MIDYKMNSAKEIATRLKVSEQHIRSLIRAGKLEAVRIGKQWVIPEDAFEKYIEDYNIVIEPDDHERLSDEIPEIIALSFFSGAMGLDVGMSLAGIDAVLACEFDKACRMTIQKNKPNIALIGDINSYNAEQILSMAKIPNNRKVDVIFGGPPCQAFSTAGKRKAFDDDRGNVFLRYLDIVSDIEPSYVVIENVRGLLSAEYPYNECSSPIKGGALLYIIDKLRESGYTVSFNLYNAANYGAPQIRERVVIIGHLGSERVPFLSPTHSDNPNFKLPSWITLGDALNAHPINDHDFIHFPEKRLKYYRMLTEGQYWKHLPIDVQKEALGKSFYLGGGKTGFLRRLSFSKPSPTLVTHPAMPATDLAHPVEDRPLSVQEYKRIQGFSEEWDICGSLLEQYKQIGNAVPIKLGEAIGRTIINHMNNRNITCVPNFKFSRYLNTDDISWEKNIRQTIQKTDSDNSKQLSLF